MIIIGFDLNSGNWVKKFFIDKAELFLRVLNARWESAEKETLYIKNLLEKIGIDKDSVILDLGCGNGRIAINLAKHGYRIVGVDISPLFIEDAKKKAREYGVADKTEFFTGNALELSKLFNRDSFDAVLMYWTTIIGYYCDREIDKKILKNIWYIVKPGGYLLLLNHSSLESLAIIHSLYRSVQFISDIDNEYVLVEKPEYIPEEAVIKNTWVFYRKKGRDLVYVDEISFTLRIYAFHEIVELAREAGWSLYAAYRDLITLAPYRPSTRGFNIVFKKM